MPFPLYDSIDGIVVNGYVDGLDNEFEQEDFNPPAEVEGRCIRTPRARSYADATKGQITHATVTGGRS